MAATYEEYVPHPALRPFVDRFWARAMAARPDGRPHPIKRILPDGCIDVMVDLAREGRAVVVGTMTRALVFAPAAPIRTVAVRFRPGGAFPFLQVPAAELTDRLVDSTLVGARWCVPARLVEAADPLDAVRTLERSLLARLDAISTPHPLVAHAVSALLRPAPPSVESLAREIGWSRQHLVRAFRRHVGIGPKQFGRVARMQRAVAAMQRERRAGLGEVAVRLGYFDQAHMARDFRELVGVPPVMVRPSAGSIRPIPSLLEEAWDPA